MKRLVLNNIRRFVFQRFKNIFDSDICRELIGTELIILRSQIPQI